MNLPKLSKGERLDKEKRALVAAELKTQYESGVSVRRLAAVLGVSNAQLYNLLEEAGTKMRRTGPPSGTKHQPKPKDPKLVARILAEYQRGRSIRAIGAKTGKSYGFVHRVIDDSDIEMRSKGSRKGVKRGKYKSRPT